MEGVICDAYLKDTTNGMTKVYSYPCEEKYLENQDSMWRECNWACDCNRLDFLYGKTDEDAPRGCSHGRVFCEKVIRRDTGEVLYAGDDSP